MGILVIFNNVLLHLKPVAKFYHILTTSKVYKSIRAQHDPVFGLDYIIILFAWMENLTYLYALITF